MIIFGKLEETYTFALGKVEVLRQNGLEKWKFQRETAWKSGKSMLVRRIDKYIKEFFDTTDKALLITGARQTGKTFSIREFGRQWECFVEINFIENARAALALKEAKDADDLLLRLSAFSKKKMEKGKTLVFFDEVQACPEVVTAIKFLVEESSSLRSWTPRTSASS